MRRTDFGEDIIGLVASESGCISPPDLNFLTNIEEASEEGNIPAT